MNVNIKRLSPDAQTPTYAHATDAGFDLVAAADGLGVRDSGRFRNADSTAIRHYTEN